jgi:excisionase family DNA binding protein
MIQAPAKLRPDAKPLTPAELIAVRKLLRSPKVEEHLDAGTVASRLGLNKRTVLEMVKRGELVATKPFPNKVLIASSSVQAWLAKHLVKEAS